MDSLRGRFGLLHAERGFACVCAALVLALSLLSPAASAAVAGCAPQVSIVEQVDPHTVGPRLGRYVMTTGDLCGMQIVALAVDNDASLAAYANLSGWNAQVVTDDFWDAGIVLSRDDFGAGTSYQVTTGSAGIGSFASFFGPAAQLANLYWLSRHYGGPVVDNSTAFTAVGTPMPLFDDAFAFETRAPASIPIVFLQDSATGATVAITAVPEPAASLLFAMGLLGLLGARRGSRVRR